MSQGIIMDITARVKGYEESIKQLRAALDKLDPGAGIAKSITRALEVAESKVKDLNKNLTPRVTSDTQLDRLTDKVNSTGDAIERVGLLMQKIDIQDINFSSFENGIQDLEKEIAKLEEELDKDLSKGLHEFINNTDELSKKLKDLGINEPSKLTHTEIFETISKKAKEAAKDTEEAQKRIAAAQKKADILEASKNKLQENKQEAVNKAGEINKIASEYTAAISKVKEQVKTGLTSILGDQKSEEVDKILSAFLGGLTPETLSAHLQQLKDQVKQELGEAGTQLKASEIYTQLLGPLGTATNSNASAIAKKMLGKEGVFGGIPKEIITQFKDKVTEISSTLGLSSEDTEKIFKLISDEKLDAAFSEASEKIKDKLNKLQEEITKEETALKASTTKLEAEKSAGKNAQNTETEIKNLTKELEIKIEQYKAASDIFKRLTDSRAQRDDLQQQSQQQIQNQGKGAAEAAKQFQIATSAVNQYSSAIKKVQEQEKLIGKLEGVVQRWFSIYAAVRMVTNAVKSVISTVKELDKTITEIAIVTNMSQQDLWGQMSSYTEMARAYASSISGVYKVSQLYYQQGLQTADVMALTEQTLKMARISGLDYATATDYMTNAVRSFKMEMTEAQTVVDVYSAIAASSATSTSELASAMSKTASSAQAVGSSFENTTAMMAVMIEATRESAENIGSAMKSIISRYGEMKADPSKLVSSEGEEMSLNKVDAALKTVGISIQDASHQFRDFDDVIMELAEKWDTIDKNTQRYIATIMAGNRQQSRFLALVSSYDRLKELTAEAADSENASQLQFLKTLDSIEAKSQQLQTSIQSLYISSGVENTYKVILDVVNNIVKSLGDLGSNQGLIAVIGKISGAFLSTALVVTNLFATLKTRYANMQQQMTLNAKVAAAERDAIAAKEHVEYLQLLAETGDKEQQIKAKAELEKTRIVQQEADKRLEIVRQEQEDNIKLQKAIKNEKSVKYSKWGMALSAVGGLLSTATANIDINQDRQLKSLLTGASGALQGIGTAMMLGGTMGGIVGTLTAIPSILESIGMLSETVEEKVSRLKTEVENTNNEKLKSKDDLKTLADYKKKYDELNKSQYESTEKKKEFIDLQNEIAATYPELIASMDVEGNYVVDMAAAYEKLAEAKQKTYKEDFINSIQAELNGLNDIDYLIQKYYSINSLRGPGGLLNTGLFSNLGNLQEVGKQYKEWYTNKKQEEFTYQLGFFGELDQRTYADIFNQTDNISSFPFTFENIEDYNTIISNMAKYADQGFSKYAAAFQTLQDHPELSQFSEYIYNFDTDLYNYFRSLGEGIKYQDELIQQAYKRNNKEWLQILKSMTNIDINDLQFEVLSNTIDDLWATYLNNYIEAHEGEDYKIGEVYSSFFDAIDISWFKAETDNIKYLQDKTANEFYSSMGKLTSSQISNNTVFKNFGKEVQDEILELYHEKYDKIINNYKKAAENLDIPYDPHIKANLMSFANTFGPDFLMNILDNYQNILNNTNLNETTKKNQLKAFNNIYTLIGNIQDVDKRNTVLSKVQSGDLTSLTGIYDLIETLESTGIDIDRSGIKNALVKLGESLAINIESEIQTISNKISSNMSDFEKAISSAEKGMDFKTASEMAAKLGKTLSDFNFIGGKYYFEDLNLIQTKYLNSNQEYLKALQKTITKQNKGYNEAAEDFLDVYGSSKQQLFYEEEKPITTMTTWEEAQKSRQAHEENVKREKWLADYGIDLTTLKAARTDYLADAMKEDNETFSEWLKRHNEEQYKAIVSASEEYEKYQINASYLTSGNISGFLKSTINIEQNNRYQEIYKSLLDNFTEQYGSITNAIALSISDNPAAKLQGDTILAEFSKLNDKAWQAYEQELTNAISIGDITNLPEELKQFASLIYNTYHQISSNIFNSITSAISGEGANLLIADATNLPTLQKMRDIGLVTSETEEALKVGDIVTISQEVLDGTKSLNDWINETFKTESERLKAIQTYHEAVNNNFKNALALTEKTDTVDFNEFTSYLSKSKKLTSDQIYATDENGQYTNQFSEAFKKQIAEYGLKYSEITGNFIINDQTKYLEQLQNDLNDLTSKNSTLEERNELQAKIDKAKNKTQSNRTQAIKTLTSNYQELSEDNIKEIATAFELDYEIFKKATKDNYDGTRSLDVASLKTTLKYDKLTDAEKANIDALLAAISDDYLSNMSTAIGYVSKGTTNQADMQKFVSDFNKKFNDQLKISDLFQWDEILETFVLDASQLQKYLVSYKTKLKEDLGLTEEQVQLYIDKQLQEFNSVDFTSFLSAENKSLTGKSYKTIRQQMVRARLSKQNLEELKSEDIEAYIEQEDESEDYNYYLPEDKKYNQQWIQYAKGQASQARQRNLQRQAEAEQKLQEAKEYNARFAQTQGEVESQVDEQLSQLMQGGLIAIQVMEDWVRENENGRELTDSEREAAYKAEVNKYLAAMNQLSSLSVGQYVANEEIATALKGAGVQFEENSNVIASIGDLETAYQNLYNGLAATNEATSAELNAAAASLLDSKYIGRRTTRDTLSKGTLNMSDLTSMYEANDKIFGARFSELVTNENGESTFIANPEAELADLKKQGFIDVNEFGEIRILKFKEFMTTMDITDETTEAYKAAYSKWLDSQLGEDTSEKRRLTQISNLISGKVGDKINVADLNTEVDKTLIEALGISEDTYTIMSEFERDNAILALDASKETDLAVREAIVQAQEQINAKRAKGTSLKGVISQSFTTDTFKSFITSMGYDAEKVNLEDWANAFGFEWDELTQQYRATIKSLAPMRHRLELMKANPEANEKSIAELETLINQLELDLAEDPAQNALTALLSSADNAKSAIAEFKTYFGDKINIDDYTYTDKDGNVKVKIEELRTAMQNAGLEYDTFFETYITQLIDSYINNIEKATSLVIQGTTSQTDIEAFKQAYFQTMKQELSDNAFAYDALLDVWTLDPIKLKEFVTEQAKELGLSESELTDYITNHTIKPLAEAIDISSFLGSENRGGLDRAKFEKQLDNYLKITATDYTTDMASGFVDIINAGGQGAVDVLKTIAASAGRELTSSEISQAYRLQIDQLINLGNQLNEYVVGQVVDKNTANLLNQLSGFNVTDDGIVLAVGNLFAAHTAIYNTLKASTLKTTAELNAQYANILNAEDQGQIDSIEVLQNAMGMTYSALGTMLNKYGQELETIMSDPETYGIKRIGNGKVRIADFNTFAQNIGLSQLNTEEYAKAYDDYVSNLISLDTAATDALNKAYSEALGEITAYKPIDVHKFSDSFKELLTADGYAELENNDIMKVTDLVGYTQNVIKILSSLSNLSPQELYDQTGLTVEDLAKNWQNAKNTLTQAQDAWSSISNNLASLTTDNIGTLISKGGLTISKLHDSIGAKIGNYYVMTLKQYEAELKNSFATDGQEVDEIKVNKLVAQARDTLVNNIINVDWSKMLNGQATEGEWASINETLITSLTSLGIEIDEIYKEGTSTIDINALVKAVQNINEEAGKLINDQIQSVIAETRDTAFDEISSGLNLVSQGTTSQADMNKFIQRYTELTKDNLSISEAFEYDSSLKSYTLSTEVLQKYLEAQKTLLIDLGVSEEETATYIENQTNSLLTANINIEDFLNSNTFKGNKIRAFASQLNKLAKIRGNSSLQANVVINKWMQDLVNGGEAAVNALKEIKGADNVSSTEIENAYKNQINRLKSASEQLNAHIGDIVTGAAINILKAADYELTDLGDGTAVVTAVGDMISAYAALYTAMKATSEATTADLNDAYAQILMAADKKNIDTLETLESADGIAYDAFAEILTTYNHKFEDVMRNPGHYGIESTGFGKIRIIDFNQFAEQMGWTIDSPEYAEAYSQWVSSMAELRNRPATFLKNAAEELKSLINAEPGEAVNVSYLDKTMKNELQVIAKENKAQLRDGLLQLGTDTNIPELVADIANAAAEAGTLLPEQLAELADVVSNFIKEIIDTINSGISGTLNNADASKLKQWASGYGIKDLDFTQTSKGLKLAQKSAIELYNTVKSIDAMQATLIFDQLNTSLAETDSHYKSITSIRARIVELEGIDNRTPILENELALAKEILAVRSTSEDSSFNFMSNKIPGGQNNPLNYYSNWASAIQKLKSAMETSVENSTGLHKGLIDYQDWYNIATEMGNMARIAGTQFEVAGVQLDGSLERTAALIQKGAQAITVDSTGNIKVALGDMGVDFEAGASEMSDGIDSGIKAVADSQVKMLDGLIAVLELIVQMQQLGDIDVEGNGIDLSDFFEITYDDQGNASIIGLKEKYNEWRQTVIDQITEGNEAYNADLANAMSIIKIDGTSLADMVHWEVTDWNKAGINIAQGFSDTMAALYKAALSNDYNTDDIMASVKEVLIASGVTDLQIDVGDTTLLLSSSGITQIDWTKDSTKKIADRFGKSESENRRAVIEALKKYENGESLDPVELDTALFFKSNVKIDDDGNIVEIKYKGKTYSGTSITEALKRGAWLEDLGAEDIVINEGNKSAVGKINVGDYKLEVISDVNGVHIKSEYSGKTYSSQSELLQGDYHWYLDQYHAGNPNYTDFYENYDAWAYATYNIHASIKTNIVDANGNSFDISKDPDTYAQLKDIYTNVQDSINKGFIYQTKDGNFEINLNGIKVKLDADKVSVDGKTANVNMVQRELADILGLDQTLQTNITAGITAAIPTLIESLNGIGDSTEPINTVTTALGELLTKLEALGQFAYEDLVSKLSSLSVPISSTSSVPTTSVNGEVVEEEGTKVTFKIDADTKEFDEKAEKAKSDVENANPEMKINANTGNAENAANRMRNFINNLWATIGVGANTKQAEIDANRVKNTISNMKPVMTVTTKYVTTGTSGVNKLNNGGPKSEIKEVAFSEAKGNVALAKGRQTLLGELGPELYVTNGHYYIAGQNGAEFIDLPDDAIVFNHLQTKKLLTKGTSDRGKPVTNEKNAVSFATGNVEGPAMASASEALAALKQLRAMWQALQNMSVADLAGKGGGGGGGGNDSKARAAFIKDLERWYNWLQKIAELEKEITYQEQLRNTIKSDRNANGAAYFRSQIESLRDINDQLVTTQSLLQSQKIYFEQRRAQLNEDNGPFNQIYSFDEKGQLKYRSDTTINGVEGGFNFLADLFKVDETGVPKYTLQEQYEILKGAGFEDYMKYDSSGKEILAPEEGKESEMDTFYQNSVKAVFDYMDGQKEEMQNLHDSITDYEQQSLELLDDHNQILQEIVDNQLAVEDRIYTAIVDSRQQAIDDAQDERDALQDNSDKFIEGLQKALDNERQMYENEQNAEELNKMRRRLGILQRTGGSASSIRSLQEQITSKEKDAYFDAQQQQIDAIQDASDAEIERLDAQIQLMTETLEYQKEHGLLWDQVATIMQGTPEQINEFIVNNEKVWETYSTTKWNEEYRQLALQTAQWGAYKDWNEPYWKSVTGETASLNQQIQGYDTTKWQVYDAAMAEVIGGEQWSTMRDKAKEYFMQELQKTEDPRKAAEEVEKIPEVKEAIEQMNPKDSGSSNVTKPTETTKPSSGGGGSKAENNKATNAQKTATNSDHGYSLSIEGKTYSNTGYPSKEAAVNAAQSVVNSYYNGAPYTGEKLKELKLKAMNTLMAYDKGGLNDYTGLAMLHGTKKRPEGILNAEQTATLRNDILGHGNSLMSLLVDFKNAMYGTVGASEYGTINNSSTNDSVVIEHVDVNVEVAKIADDYDVHRLGGGLKDEMLKIARKNGVQNNLRG